MRRTLGVMVVSAFLAGEVAAQSVRGTVSDPAGAPVPGVVVLLVDSADAIAGRALTNDLGGFLVRAQKAGAYRVRTLRIGFKPELTESIALGAAQEVQRRISLTNLPISLESVRIAGRTSCGSSALANGAATLDVLEQTRAALTATELTSGAATISATSVLYRRVMDPNARNVLGERVSIHADSGAQPWQSFSVDTLRNRGYVFESGDSLVYRAPGLEMLTSEAFVTDHCFRLVEGREKELIGVAFEPAPERRRVSEIRGTLWVDRASSELRSLEFRYANVETAISEARAGGDAEFVRMKNGSWVISKWNIRMPVLQNRQRSRLRGTMGGSGGDINIEVGSVNVVGGTLSHVTRAEDVVDTLWTRAPLVVTGAISDSASGAPVVDARLSLRGTAANGVSDARGNFAIPGALPGNYVLEVRTPSLDSVGAVNALAYTLTDSAVPIRVRVPNATQLVTSMCGAQLRTLAPAMQGVLFGSVGIAGDSGVAARANVVAEWTEGADDEFRWKEGRADENGRFRLCGVPIGKSIVLRAMTDSGSAEPVLATIARDRKFVRAEMAIDPAVPGTGVLAGLVVRDSANNPIADAEIVITATGKSILTSRRGAFRLREVPAGTHEVTVRKLGYGPMTTKITFAANQTVSRRIVLNPVQVLTQVDISAERMRDPLMKLFEENRKIGLGKFITRAELEARPNTMLSTFFREIPAAALTVQGNRAWLASNRGCLQKVSLGPTRPDMAPVIFEEAGGGEKIKINGCCFPSVYLDRARMYSGRDGEPVPNINRFLTQQLEGIEYYPGLSTVPAEYAQPNQKCGVLVLHTRRGGD